MRTLHRAFDRHVRALMNSIRSRYQNVPGAEELELLRDPAFRESWDQFRRGEGRELHPEIRERCDG